MPLSMYQASTPRFSNMLRNLSVLLDKAEAHCEAKKIEPAALLQFRLYPDMFTFTRQVQIACDTAKGAAARLAGIEMPKHEDNEQSFADLKKRISSTLAFMESVKASQIDGSEEREVKMKMRGQDVTFKGAQYLLGFAYPNFYFHVTTAYNILRHNGIELSKRDYIGNP